MGNILRGFKDLLSTFTDRIYSNAGPKSQNGHIQERRYGLIQEIEALYQRSLIPEDEKVVFAQGPMLNISHEVLMELHDIPGVIATEVRTNELIIDISSSMQNAKGLSAQIDACLQRNSKKVEYKIQTVSLKPYSSYTCGQKVYAADGIKFGTLGGFFESKGNRIHAVLSKHVVEQLPSEMLILNNEEICEIPAVMNNSLDIAIANVLVEFNAQCQTLFPNEDFTFVPGKLWLKGVTSLVGLDVFIWGATSRPGYGLIKTTVCFEKEDHFIITDSTVKPFCKEGDSGAIVCAEPREGGYIYIVAMVIGAYIKKNDTPSQYLALPLKEGLEKLREEYSFDFSILGGSEI